jgi:hypothetical protein
MKNRRYLDKYAEFHRNYIGKIQENDVAFFKHIGQPGPDSTFIFWKRTGRISKRRGHINPN